NYERYWKSDSSWTPDRYATVLSTTSAPIAFCFDDQAPDPDPTIAAATIRALVGRDQEVNANVVICPIVHGHGESLVGTFERVVEPLQPLVIAVAERELGDGLLIRASSIKRLRAILDA